MSRQRSRSANSGSSGSQLKIEGDHVGSPMSSLKQIKIRRQISGDRNFKFGKKKKKKFHGINSSKSGSISDFQSGSSVQDMNRESFNASN